MGVAAIVTLAEAKGALNDATGTTTNDPELLQFIGAMSDVVEYIVGPVRAQQITEWHEGGSDTILLNNHPVISVDSVTEYSGIIQQVLTEQSPDTSSSYNAAGYFVRYDIGTLQRTVYGTPSWFGSPAPTTRLSAVGIGLAQARGQGRVKVVYTAGRGTVPEYVKRATLELIRLTYGQTQQGGIPTYGQDSADDVPTGNIVMGYLVPFRVAEMLQPGRQAGGVG